MSPRVPGRFRGTEGQLNAVLKNGDDYLTLPQVRLFFLFVSNPNAVGRVFSFFDEIRFFCHLFSSQGLIYKMGKKVRRRARAVGSGGHLIRQLGARRCSRNFGLGCGARVLFQLSGTNNPINLRRGGRKTAICTVSSSFPGKVAPGDPLFPCFGVVSLWWEPQLKQRLRKSAPAVAHCGRQRNTKKPSVLEWEAVDWIFLNSSFFPFSSSAFIKMRIDISCP